MSAQLQQEVEQKCLKIIEHFKKELSGLRGGRANAAMFEHLQVDYYGSRAPLQTLAMISIPEPRLVLISVYDPSAAEAVEKAIQSSELGLNPSREGTSLRIVIPALNDDRRKQLQKQAGKLSEENKVRVRGVRHDTLEELKKQEKAKKISQDDQRRSTEQVQKVIDKYNKIVDDLLIAKEKELLEG